MVVKSRGLLMKASDYSPRSIDEDPPAVRAAQEVYAESDFGIAGRIEIQAAASGANGDLAAVMRHPGYHSTPHVSSSEQMFYCVEGETWIFSGDKGYLMQPGDFMRVPKDVIHWAWNRSDKPSMLVQSHVPVILPGPRQERFYEPLFWEDEERRGMPGVRTTFTDIEHAIEVEKRLPEFAGLKWSPMTPSLLVKEDDLPWRTFDVEYPWLDVAAKRYPEANFQMAGFIQSKRAQGNEGTLMVGIRHPNYHSSPHAHDCEQMNYAVDGEVWIFVDDEGYLMQPGDMHRVPANTVHWAWNRSDKPSTLVETHVPEAGGVGLYDQGEVPHPPSGAPRHYADTAFAIDTEHRQFGDK